MNETTVLSVKLDKKLKNEAQEVAKSMGFPLSTLVSAYLRQLRDTRRVEFSAPTKVTPKLRVAILNARKEIERGDIEGPFESAIDFTASLNK
ncbi:hypothetical protein COU14_01740 [Candidatus Kaiserbacteria bacterium CG10_big_fil_rev_8_21_14_0_10_44_10]|uniref:Type II toxin-antitoxin system antitoxin, RelB/DinJ family n=1 Tax=Candidatus Kaiserbacteria bacterium CG10_big_fil_rev_8_21_14_0_10_44_10 TaxID=1974606 RepID=A0A2H0UHP9_9BACT|nr:MAG: hypothetical protein COU14_01740 [Candidatus Kaiserbacteria bacterium CG10_big_fil_rev_8_21_14_0_10_44_10]